jgi:DNA-binding MarR family transcriptional regulator
MQVMTGATAEQTALQALVLVPRLYRWVQTRAPRGSEVADLSLRQLSALRVIRSQSTTLGEIARQLMVTPAVITGLIDRLEKRGYVQRVTEPGDRRRIYLQLTEAGRRASEAAEMQIADELAAHLGNLSVENLEALDRGLGILGQVVAELETPGGASRV